MFKKILIANRGEIALRVIRTCKEMGIKSVAVYSTADAESLHVKFADEAVCIGPAPSTESYLKMSNVIAAAEITNADAIHPGYGFLSENAKFSKICEEHGIKFIGASAEMIDKMGDKASAKATMKAAGVPCVPGSDGIIESYEECEKLAEEVGYPVMLKATAGGGGKGMRGVWKKEDLKGAWDSARQESKAAFGNDDMYMEKLIEEPRHIEIQVVGDSTGLVVGNGVPGKNGPIKSSSSAVQSPSFPSTKLVARYSLPTQRLRTTNSLETRVDEGLRNRSSAVVFSRRLDTVPSKENWKTDKDRSTCPVFVAVMSNLASRKQL